MNDLTGKTAIVTGASKGIGAAIAKALAAAGAAVAVNYASDKEGAERVVAEITGKGGKALAIRADMSKAAEVKQLFEATKKALGAPKMLVNNAGVFDFKPVQDITEAEFHRHVDINVLGPMLAIQEALKHFPPEGGSIVNISSIASQSPVPSSSLYSATKAALDAMTAALAKEFGPRELPRQHGGAGLYGYGGQPEGRLRRQRRGRGPGRGHAARRQVSAGRRRLRPRSCSWPLTMPPG